MTEVSPDKLYFVQFLHPGKEHKPDRGAFKCWNHNAHKRKFLQCNGRRFGSEVEEPLHFWAEWEPESEVIAEIAEPFADEPKFTHAPYYIQRKSYAGLQNTDPFVFGNNFFYTGCQQHTISGPTKLRYLKRGSVILFGSCLNERSFALDNVFVVDHWIDHRANNFKSLLKNHVPIEYLEVTLLPWYELDQCSHKKQPCASSVPERSWRLYFGATPANPVEGMFSFFPCQPAQLSPRGFARPTISISDVVTGKLSQGKKLNAGLDLGRIRELFSLVRSQVESVGLHLGVYAEIPQRRDATSLP
jgi:hypothetical protein